MDKHPNAKAYRRTADAFRARDTKAPPGLIADDVSGTCWEGARWPAKYEDGTPCLTVSCASERPPREPSAWRSTTLANDDHVVALSRMSAVREPQEQKGGPGRLPDEGAISVMTLAELHIGVLLARGPRIRAQRLRTLARVERTFDPLPVDDAVARAFAEIVADARRKRRQPRVVDCLIAATAVARGLPLYSQDRDFGSIPGVKLVLV